MAESICRLLNKKLFIINLGEAVARGLDFEWVIEGATRQALFQQALMYIENFEKITEDVKGESFLRTLSATITKYKMMRFLSSNTKVMPVFLSNRHTLISIDFPPTDHRSNSVLWKSISKKYLLDDNINLESIKAANFILVEARWMTHSDWLKIWHYFAVVKTIE